MLLCELKASQVKKSKRQTADRVIQSLTHRGLNVLGAGVEATVFDHNHHGINKALKVGIGTAYSGFITTILPLNNPYFPQVDEIKQLTASNGTKYFTTRLEKLHKLTDLNIKLLNVICESLKIPECQHNYAKNHTESQSSIATRIANRISWLVYYKNKATSQLEDTNLLQALEVLRTLDKKYNGLDIHEDNIMVRLTPYGPHLVITDPVVSD